MNKNIVQLDPRIGICFILEHSQESFHDFLVAKGFCGGSIFKGIVTQEPTDFPTNLSIIGLQYRKYNFKDIITS